MFIPSPIRLTLLAATAACLFLSGCDCTGSLSGRRACSSSRDCPSDERCRDGYCVQPEDSGTTRPPDTGPTCLDRDEDGRCNESDCDDFNPQRGGPEVCDGIDNDCDDIVDEGFQLCPECGGCNEESQPGPAGWEPDEDNAEGVIVDDDGALTLGRSVADAFAVWVANTDEGTVSKLDSRTGNELGRYPTVGAMAPDGTRAWNETCGGNRGNCPSRTAVDQNFDAYVANRAFGNQGSVTKYANEESNCIDRNSNGIIETSRDLNGDGRIDISSEEFVGVDDECILWTTAVGNNNGVPRAIAVEVAAPDAVVGNVWVGLYQDRQACQLDAITGARLACIDLDGFRPYGMATAANGAVWVVDRSNRRRDVLGAIDPIALNFTAAPNVPSESSCANAYGMTVDGMGDVFIANDCAPNLWRYRPSTMEWTSISYPDPCPGSSEGSMLSPCQGTARGLAADENSLWVAISHDGYSFRGGDSNRVLEYRLSDLSYITTHNLPTGRRPVGIGVSFDGSVWAICQANNLAARFDPTTGVWSEHEVGEKPYTYSDFIGFGLNVFAEPRGSYRFIVDGCPSDETRWEGLEYRAEAPPETSTVVYARSADTRDALEALPWIGPFETNPARFQEAPGPLTNARFLEVELRLATEDRRIAPRIFDLRVARTCIPNLD